MEESDVHHRQQQSVPPPPSIPLSSPSSSSSVEENDTRQDHEEPPRLTSILSYRVNMSSSDVPSNRTISEAWSCLVVLITFWSFVSMITILGIFGSVDLQLGPNYSRLIQTDSFFVQAITAEDLHQQQSDPLMLYGFHKPPPLDVEITWNETHNAVLPVDLHKEWLYFLNKGSKVHISYSVKSSSFLPVLLVIAQGRESLEEWIEDPSYPNITLSWNIIYGNGEIQQEIPLSSNYYVAVGNLNTEEVEVQLRLTIKAFLYNTTKAYYKCSLGSNVCSFTLNLLGTDAAVLTSPGVTKGHSQNYWYVKLSYGPRWITYFIGSGVMTIVMLLVFKFCNMFQAVDSDRTGVRANTVSERTSLLLHKDDDATSWGSSYDSISHEEEDLEEWLAVNSLEGKPSNEGENNSTVRRFCIICCDAPRDCFFLPCGHCATCFTCGTRISEEAGTCPICRRKMKKVRKIFTV